MQLPADESSTLKSEYGLLTGHIWDGEVGQAALEARRCRLASVRRQQGGRSRSPGPGNPAHPALQLQPRSAPWLRAPPGPSAHSAVRQTKQALLEQASVVADFGSLVITDWTPGVGSTTVALVPPLLCCVRMAAAGQRTIVLLLHLLPGPTGQGTAGPVIPQEPWQPIRWDAAKTGEATQVVLFGTIWGQGMGGCCCHRSEVLA